MSDLEYFSTDEVVERLHKLTDEEHVLLVRIARRRWSTNQLQNSPHTSPDDLLQEALRLTLHGRAKWKRNVKLHTHFWMLMRQIAGKWAKSGKISTQGSIVLGEDQREKEDIFSDCDTVCEEIFEHEVVEFARALFADDHPAWQVLEARLQGRQRRDIVTSMGITEMEYSAIHKRITRKLKDQKKRRNK